MNKYVLLKQMIAILVFVGLSNAMDKPYKFETNEDMEQERLNLVSGFMGRHENYKNIYCEEILKVRDHYVPNMDGRTQRWVEGKLKRIQEDMTISDSVRSCFEENLPFKSTDEEIRKAFLTFKQMQTIPQSNFNTTNSKQKNASNGMTTTDDCECVIF